MTIEIDAGTQAPLVQEATFLFDLGLGVFLSDPETGTGSRRGSEFDPIKDRESVVEMCQEYPHANLQAVVDKEAGFVAVAVGVGQYKHEAADAFATICEAHGTPNTLSYVLPDGTTYYIFKRGAQDFRPDGGSGIRVLTGPEGLPAYPSSLDGQQVKKQGANVIQNIDHWLGAVSGSPPATGSEEVPPVEIPLAHEPEEAAETMAVAADPPPGNSMQVTEVVPSKEPSEVLSAAIAAWVSGGADKTTVLSMALEWNNSMREPLKLEMVVSLVEKLTESHVETEEPLTPKEKLFKLAESIVLFHDNQSKPYFFYEGEAFAAPSMEVKNRLAHHYLTEVGDLPPKKLLNEVLAILESRARFDGARVSLYNRVATSDGAIHYDLRDKRFVRITSAGWEIIPSFPLFRRYQHMQPQTEPFAGGDPWTVFDFLTVPEESRLLVMVYIVSLFVPQIAHPVLAVCGDQGSAKSFLCTLINRLVDPTLTERVIQPKNERDLIQTLRQKYVAVLDNLSKIDNRVSDIFCQVCTGGSVSYRQLYTDEGENIAQFRHVVILNSISLAIVNADLMDRSIILKLRRIDPIDRKPEHELWSRFEATRPSILGGIFDTISRAMEIYPTVEVEHLPRLADFAKWGYAIAEALGQSGNKFLDDFNHNVKRQNESVVEKNVLCQAVLTLMADGKPYLAKVSEAHERLKSIAKQDAKDETFPKLPHHLRGDLDKLRASLLEHGIEFKFFERGRAGVRILITKTGASETPTDALASDAGCVPDEPREAPSDKPIIVFGQMPEVIGE